jgi:hypothetical protein
MLRLCFGQSNEPARRLEGSSQIILITLIPFLPLAASYRMAPLFGLQCG